MKVKTAQFLTSATAPQGWPKERRPEVAFAGRSNVGKSSLINALTGRRTLARVSGTPGRTRLLNFIDVELAAAPEQVRLVDLPGYGYAKVAKTERRRWGPMIEGYVTEREELVLVLVVVDVRHPPSELDVRMVEWVRELGRPLRVVATKIDKLPKSRQIPAVRAMAEALGCGRDEVIGFSAVTGQGRDVVWREIAAAADAPAG